MTLRAIDLYAGIGGWSLGLRLAGVEVVASYEWWQPAVDTHNGNHGGSLTPIDIRKLELVDLPSDIDLVVGSPPCTQFSYSNRGGSGDQAEGLKDLVKFLEVVEHLKPRFWALENVPRVAEVLRYGLATPNHPLHRFAHLKPHVTVLDFSDYGAPQSRRRCIAGNIPLEFVEAYRTRLSRRTLGDVVGALSAKHQTIDPVWGVALPRNTLTEMQEEPALNAEELRMNREAKTYHPVYNNMAFPDPLDAPARTVTATCTRVSRESIVIADPKHAGRFRRLTIRERACLQGFPITYQFYARSFAEKAKMVGNAIPPTFTYLLAQAAEGVSLESFRSFTQAGSSLSAPEKTARVTTVDAEGRTYLAGRSFRAALPGLRFKSGMRFELSNGDNRHNIAWRVRFFFGSSQDIRQVDLDGSIGRELRSSLLSGRDTVDFRARLLKAEMELAGSDPAALQAVWTHRATGLAPYDVVDLLGELAAEAQKALQAAASESFGQTAASYVLKVAEGTEGDDRPLPNANKLRRYATPILSGFIVGDWFNTLVWHRKHKAAA